MTTDPPHTRNSRTPLWRLAWQVTAATVSVAWVLPPGARAKSCETDPPPFRAEDCLDFPPPDGLLLSTGMQVTEGDIERFDAAWMTGRRLASRRCYFHSWGKSRWAQGAWNMTDTATAMVSMWDLTHGEMRGDPCRGRCDGACNGVYV
jgi:hypothetical protein